MEEKIKYLTKTTRSGVVIRYPDPAQFPAVELEEKESTGDKLVRIEEKFDKQFVRIFEKLEEIEKKLQDA